MSFSEVSQNMLFALQLEAITCWSIGLFMNLWHEILMNYLSSQVMSLW